MKTAADTEAAINRLVDAGYGERFVDPPDTEGGRPSEGFQLTTLSTSTKPHETRETRGFVDDEGEFRGEPAFLDWGAA